MKIMTLFLLIAFIKSYQAFQLDLYQQQNRIQSTLQISSKKAHVQIDIETSQVIICCKPTRSIFQKIYYFLSNPFLHSFQYSCLEPQKTFQVDSLKLPILGPIDLPYRSIQSRYCYSGSLGLNKKSDFMTLLRQGQNQFFTIYIKTFENQKRDDKLFFGQKLPNEQIQSTIVLPSNDQQQWSVQALNVTINSQGFGKSKIILTTKNKVVKIPKGAFRQILMALKKKQCIVKQQQIFCPCETGKAQNYPKISFYFENNSIDINPQEYMQIHSEVCKVLIQAQNSLNVWKVNLFLFNNLGFSFNHMQNKISISKMAIENESTGQIKLPIQLMLNCSVILILCIFVALVLVELIKRFSGLADVRNETFRQYMIRRQL